MKSSQYTKGFTLTELLISIFIISILTVTVSTFQTDIFSLNFSLQGHLNAQLDGRHLIRVMVSELRTAAPSNTGAFPIVLASSTAITFYSDINHNGLQDKVRYFLNGTMIQKGVVIPTGNPLTYDDTTEKITTLMSGVVASTTPMFDYYAAVYTATTSPLVQPVDPASVRLVKITVIIDKDVTHSPSPIIVTSQVNIRNLKDNL